MGEFNGKITAEFTPPKTWVLEKGLSFVTEDLTEAEIHVLQRVGANVADTGRISVKKGTSTDLASTPRILWNLIAPWDIARAAIIHDHLYATLRTYYENNVRQNKTDVDEKVKIWRHARALSDKVFLLGMESADPSVPTWKIKSAYWAVRMFGSWPASKIEDNNEV
jgi:hypothetical protein